MYDYTIKFTRSDGTIGNAKFTEPNESEVRKSFKACYRHDKYTITEITVTVNGHTVAEQLDNIAIMDNITPAQKEAIEYAASVIRFLEEKQVS
jgi:hypothetical protein